MKYLRHLKEVHNEMVVDLLEQENVELADLFNFKEFCVKQKDAMLNHLIESEKWEAPVVVKSHQPLKPELVQLEDSVDEVGEEEQEIQNESKDQDCSEGDNQESEVKVMEHVLIQNRGREEMEFTCQVCDQTFQKGLSVSLHMFQEHLRDLTSVWEPLVKPASPAAFPHSWTCVLCSETFSSRAFAQLHIYTESQHKRMLKQSMEARGENWEHTLEFVRFKIPADEISEEEEKDDDHVAGDETVTSSTLENREVTNWSEGAMGIVECAQPAGMQRIPGDAAPAGQIGATPSMADDQELDYEPEDEDNNNMNDVLNIGPPSVQHDAEVKDNNDIATKSEAGDQMNEGLKEGAVKIDRGAAFEVSCTHARGGCEEVFNSIIEVHQHARKCRYRPSNSFPCSTQGCGKR